LQHRAKAQPAAGRRLPGAGGRFEKKDWRFLYRQILHGQNILNFFCDIRDMSSA
jgi:hypothetical protein